MSSSILFIAAERGLGLVLAREFFRRGWSVTGTARPSADIGELKQSGAMIPRACRWRP